MAKTTTRCEDCNGTGYTIDGDRLLGYARYHCATCDGSGEGPDPCVVCGTTYTEPCPSCTQRLCGDCLPDKTRPCVYCEDEAEPPSGCATCGDSGEVPAPSITGINGGTKPCSDC